MQTIELQDDEQVVKKATLKKLLNDYKDLQEENRIFKNALQSGLNIIKSVKENVLKDFKIDENTTTWQKGVMFMDLLSRVKKLEEKGYFETLMVDINMFLDLSKIMNQEQLNQIAPAETKQIS